MEAMMFFLLLIRGTSCIASLKENFMQPAS